MEMLSVGVCVTLGRGTALLFLEVNRVCMCAHNFYVCVCFEEHHKGHSVGLRGTCPGFFWQKGTYSGLRGKRPGTPWTPAVTLTESGSAPQCLRWAQEEEGEEGERQRNREGKMKKRERQFNTKWGMKTVTDLLSLLWLGRKSSPRWVDTLWVEEAMPLWY